MRVSEARGGLFSLHLRTHICTTFSDQGEQSKWEALSGACG